MMPNYSKDFNMETEKQETDLTQLITRESFRGMILLRIFRCRLDAEQIESATWQDCFAKCVSRSKNWSQFIELLGLQVLAERLSIIG
jgi:hypothetical protein